MPMSKFTVTSGRIAIGDPTMGLVEIEVGGSGQYRLQCGALTPPQSGAAKISLDSPAIFVVDATHREELEEWYHRVGNETSYDLMSIQERLAEAQKELGVEIGFYWENELAPNAEEGAYGLDIAKLDQLA